MSYYVDRKFALLISTRLEQFKQKGDGICQFRCPFCGDSKKNKTKTRGYFYRKKQGICFQCHNCGLGMSIGSFIQKLDSTLYKEYQIARFKDEHVSPGVKKPSFDQFKTSSPVFGKTKEVKIKLPTIASLPDTHSAKKYILSRKIPEPFLKELFYADDFLSFIDEVFPGHGKKLLKEEARIVIPFYSKEGSLQGVQGRALSNSKIRYITIKKTPESIKLFGLNHVDLSKPIHVVEGPFDSMFLDNAIATMDSALFTIQTTLGPHDYVFVFDNEPRNKQILEIMEKTIDMGFDVVVWPAHIQSKDINEMILREMTTDQLKSIIAENTHKGLKAKLKLTSWRKM